MAQQTLEERFNVDNKTVIRPAFWNQFIGEVGVRLRALEAIKIAWEEVSNEGIAVALERINEALGPAAERINKIAELGFLIAPSSTSATLALGPAEFIISDGDQRDLFVPSPFVAITREANVTDYAIGRTVSYDNATGALAVLIEYVYGDPGPHADWQIAAVAGSVKAVLTALEAAEDARDSALTYKNTAVASASAAAGSASAAAGSASSAAGSATTATTAKNEVRQIIAPSGPTPPVSPSVGMFWYDNSIVRVWDGSGWAAAVTASIGGLSMLGGTFGAAPTGVITIPGGFSSVMVWVNGNLLKAGDDYTASTPTVTITSPVEGDQWFYWAYQAIDATDYYTKAQSNTLLDAKAPLASPTFTGTVTLPGDPTLDLHAATKQYVDNIAAGLDPKPSVRLATATALPTNTRSSNVLTASANGILNVDGVTVSLNDRVLVKNEATAANNGIYSLTQLGTVSAPWKLTRVADMDSWAEVPGSYCWVEEGSTLADTAWVATSDKGGTINSTAITWAQWGGTGAYQAASATLTSLAGASANGVSLVTAADYSAMRSLLGLVSSAVLYPENNEYSGSNYAALDLRNGHPIAVFPDSVVAVYIGTTEMPEAYTGGNVTVEIDWMCSGTSTSKACFGVAFERMDIGSTDMDADSFGTQTIDTTGVAASATSGVKSRTSITVSSANVDGAVAGDQIRLKVTRETGQTNDTNAGDIQVTRIKLRV